MKQRNFSRPIEPLECRRMLSLSRFGAAITLNSDYSDVADIGDGSYDIAYLANGVRFARFSPAGQQVGKTNTLYAQDSGFSGSVSVSVDLAGNAIVAYRIDDTSGASLDPGIYYNYIRNDGTVFPRETLTTDATATAPTVSGNATGDYFIAWMENGSAKSEWIQGGTTNRGAPVLLDASNKSKHVLRVTIAANSGDSAAVYVADEFYSDTKTVKEVIGSVTRTSPGGNEMNIAGQNASIALTSNNDASDNVVIAFERFPDSNDTPSQATTFVQRYSVGNLIIDDVGEPVQIGLSLASPNGAGIRPDGIAIGNNSYFVRYTQSLQSRTDKENVENTLYVQRYTQAGEPDAGGPISLAVGDRAGTTGRQLLGPQGGFGIDKHGRLLVAVNTDTPANGAQTNVFRLTTQFAAYDNGTLYLFGTAHADSLSVKTTSRGDRAAIGNSTLDFDRSDGTVTSISFEGFRGDDRIYNETSIGSTIRGDDGNDELSGGSAHDAIFGGDGNDRIDGNDGNDSIYGQNGNDSLRGGNNTDYIDGANGNDTIFGDDGSDQLYGGAGNDRLYGGTGGDSLYGDAGNDFFNTVDNTSDRLDGGTGNNRASADSVDLLLNIQKTS